MQAGATPKLRTADNPVCGVCVEDRGVVVLVLQEETTSARAFTLELEVMAYTRRMGLS